MNKMELTQISKHAYISDFEEYREAQNRVNNSYKDRRDWARRALKNIANAGKFSSDRTIMEYAKEIWDIKPVKVENYID